MNLKEGNILFVRIDYKIGEKTESEQDGIDTMEYWQRLSENHYVAAGIFGDMDMHIMNGAMVIFEAKDMAEAEEISTKDPIIERGFYRYELYKWNIMLTSQIAGK